MTYLKLVANLTARLAYTSQHRGEKFRPGITPIPVSGKFFEYQEIAAAISASMDFWLTAGPETEKFEAKLSKVIGVRHALMVNSGSSANLAAVSALTSKKLGERRLKPGDEVITVAAGFPTTVAPLIQNGLVPVYVDVDLGTYVSMIDRVEEAISSKTRAIVMAHTLGNPFDLQRIKKLCDEKSLWLIEDACDALGGTYQNKMLGSFGDLATFSFYPAHHITTGEGGAVVTNRPMLKPIVESFRDWGRDCWCPSGHDNTCFKRFGWQLGELPEGYDHKYTYSHLGYNLKSGDIQAAIGSVQLDRLPSFVSKRKNNWKFLKESLSGLEEFLLLPEATVDSDPSWFGFAVTLRESCAGSREDLLKFLNSRQIGTRLLFAGNLLKQPAFIETPRRVVGNLDNTNIVLTSTFWIGVWPGLTESMLNYIVESFYDYFRISQ
jgi:CDP-6-deoxy-D-xylo-4-hexulose-3-dehydrase